MTVRKAEESRRMRASCSSSKPPPWHDLPEDGRTMILVTFFEEERATHPDSDEDQKGNGETASPETEDVETSPSSG